VLGLTGELTTALGVVRLGLGLGLGLETTGLWTILRIGETELAVGEWLALELADCEAEELADCEAEALAEVELDG